MEIISEYTDMCYGQCKIRIVLLHSLKSCPNHTAAVFEGRNEALRKIPQHVVKNLLSRKVHNHLYVIFGP
jgi:hypothetical protein